MKLNKYFVWFLFASAMFIAANAAYFSVKGIALLFSGSFLSVAVMATSLEIGKLFAASFLYRFWNDMTKSLKTYLSIATVGLVGVTSLGIYGYLTNAFEYTRSKVELYENNIDQLKDNNKYVTQEISKLEQSTDTTDGKIDDAIQGFEKIYNEYVERQEKNKADLKEKFDKASTEINNRRKEHNDRLTALDSIIANIESQPGGLFSSKKKKLDEEKNRQAPERDSINAALSDLNGQYSEKSTQYDKELQAIQDGMAGEYKTYLGKVDNLRETTSTNETSVQDKIEELYEKIKNNDTEIINIQGNIRDTDIGTFRFVARAFGIEVDTAVKWFTIAIVCLFDPLAICLVIGFNMAHLKLYGTGQEDDEVIQGPVEERYAKTRKEMKEHLKEKFDG